ncbi:MAG: V-type ATP synthase subunit E [Oscillospiraceae bacterium]|nr:V-type ATP synthase subunit E [Oscillospiraceae bacterium]MCD7749438.1 V-type ATP synthase subunit E [Oscillospiraceae bacterium]
MNGIDKITARIEADAVADAARIAEETKAQCDSIREEGEKKAQEHYWEKVRQGVKATEERSQRLAKTADMEARKSVLSCKQEIVAEAFVKAEEKIRALSGDKYINFLASLAARAAVTGTEELVLSAADKKTIGSKVLSKANAKLTVAGKPGRLTLASETGSFTSGLICRKGSVSVNCTIEVLMSQAREDMASQVAAELFS